MRRLHLPIQNPCHEDWSAMHDDGAGRRFCDVCTKHVHDISAMTEQTARAVLADESAKGRVCVRYTLDAAGQIKFKPQTVEAPSFWRMTAAAATLALTMLTGCADAQPDRIERERCVYEVGPWSFTAQRGEGTCPAADEPEHLVMGQVEAVIEPPPEPPAIHEVKGDVAPVDVMGEAPMIEPPPPPERELMGKIAVEPAPERELMGDVAMPVDMPVDALVEPPEQPCDRPAREGPRRI